MWTFNDIRIIATEKDADDNQIIASLNPLGGGTTNQVFGYEDEVVRLVCVVVGDNDLDALSALTRTGLSYTLSGTEGIEGTYLLRKLSHRRKPIYRQTIRPDLSPYAPVYWCDMELLEE